VDGGALNGVRIVEFATMVSGPFCGKLLADMGADVLKIEPPEGDPSRLCGPFPKTGPHPEYSALFLYNNTSKRGITLNPTTEEGAVIFKRLIEWADILIDNHQPGYLEARGINPSTLQQINPTLIYTSITPYGLTGPRVNVKGDELTLIHAGGLGNLLPARAVNAHRAPVKMGGYAVGYQGAITASLATLGALIGSKKTGRGRIIDISLQEVILNMVRNNVAGYRYQGTTWSRVPDRPPAMGRMQTSDGYIVIGTPENHHFIAFRELMGNPEWLAGKEWERLDYRIHHLMDVAPQMEDWMRKQTNDGIHHEAAKKGIAIGPMNSVKDVMNNEQYDFRNYFVEIEHPKAGKHKYAGWPYKMSATPPQAARPAPLLGQHNTEIYCSHLGYSPDEMKRLKDKGVI